MSKKWVVVAKGADYNKIAKDHNISPYLARIIRNRGAVSDEEIDMFLNADISLMRTLKGLFELPQKENIKDVLDAQACFLRTPATAVYAVLS